MQTQFQKGRDSKESEEVELVDVLMKLLGVKEAEIHSKSIQLALMNERAEFLNPQNEIETEK